MGTLRPGATYIYEKVNGITYRREPRSMHREEIGRDYTRTVKDSEESWKDILVTAEHNPALQKAVDRVIMLYRLSKDAPK